MFKNDKLKEFISYIQELSDHALRKHDQSWNVLSKYKLELFVIYGEKGSREPDIQNMFDVICDSMQGILYEDDKQIKSIYGEKKYEKNTWKFEIRLSIIK